MTKIVALDEFISICHEHYTSSTFAFIGLKKQSDDFDKNSQNKAATLFIGDTDPGKGAPTSRIEIGKFIKYSGKNGKFTDQLIKAVLTYIYSEWDEYYRHEIAKELGIEAKKVSCDLIGDLRNIRNCIVHRKSIISNEHSKMLVLNWKLAKGDLTITEEMFTELMKQINKMQVYERRN